MSQAADLAEMEAWREPAPGMRDASRTSPPSDLAPQDLALLDLLRALDQAGYIFTTPAPNAHRRLLLRRRRAASPSLADIFGWNRPFDDGDLPSDLMELVRAGGALARRGGSWISRLRVARVGGGLFLHSGFPVADRDHVFLGPDSYRFVDFLRAELPELRPGARVADIGAGTGVGGVFVAGLALHVGLTMTDVNAEALRLARINAAFAGLAPDLRLCEALPPGDGRFDLVVANPPYIADSGLTYSDGGGTLGVGLSLEWAKTATSRLAPSGRMLLYSGVAIVRGRDALHEGLADLAAAAGCELSYRELDPDVFPATLLRPRYWRVERIAAVGAVIAKPGR